MDKEDGVYTLDCYSANRKKKIVPFVIIWIDHKRIMLSEINQTKKKTYTV